MHPPTPKRTSSATRARGPVVLLVDDVEDVRSAFVELLVRDGFGVLEAANGHEAIVKAHALRPDVIVLDLTLPLLGGSNALRVLRANQRTRKIPVIALTGYTLERERHAQFDCVLTKPCMPDVLLRAIRDLLARATSVER